MPRRFAFPYIPLLALAALACLVVLKASDAEAQSFNCRYAKTPDEVLICHDSRLAKLDEQMASIFSSMRNSLSGPQQASLEARQKSWLHARMTCGRDADCLAAAYTQRIAELTSLQHATQQQTSDNAYWFVANTKPPDAYLALRTAPSAGQRIAMLPNGTLLQVLQRRPDRWWLVRVVGTGQQGWVLSGQGDRVWIECCQTAGAAPNSTATNALSPAQKLPSAAGQSGSISVPLKHDGGTYTVPVLINNAITLDFIVDSGASDVSIPADVVMTLIRTGTINEGDFIGKQSYTLADGSTVPSVNFRIRSLKVGNTTLEDVVGSVAPAQGSLLLGQSFLSRFKSWSINNSKKSLDLVE